MASKVEYQDLEVKGTIKANKIINSLAPSDYLLQAGGGSINPSVFARKTFFEAKPISDFAELSTDYGNYYPDSTLSEYMFLAKALFPQSWTGGKITLTLTPMVFQKGWDYNLKVVFANYMKATGARLFIENDLAAMVGVSTLIKIIIDNNIIVIEAYVEG